MRDETKAILMRTVDTLTSRCDALGNRVEELEAALDRERDAHNRALDKLAGIKWAVCESEALNDPAIKGVVRAILTEVADIEVHETASQQ